MVYICVHIGDLTWFYFNYIIHRVCRPTLALSIIERHPRSHSLGLALRSWWRHPGSSQAPGALKFDRRESLTWYEHHPPHVSYIVLQSTRFGWWFWSIPNVFFFSFIYIYTYIHSLLNPKSQIHLKYGWKQRYIYLYDHIWTPKRMSVNYHYHPRKNAHHKAKKAKTQPAFGATTRCSHSFPCQWACRKHPCCGNVSENTENTKQKKNGPHVRQWYETYGDFWAENGCCSLFLLAGWYQTHRIHVCYIW